MKVIRIAKLYQDLEQRLEELSRDRSAVEESRRRLEAALKEGGTHYGVNTGFGVLSGKRIDPDRIWGLQRNLLLSHAVGVGDPIPRELSRLMLKLKIHGLGLGFSGVSPPVFQLLLDFVERDLIPLVPSRGSVGASGDLAPLAHLSLPLVGLGQFWNREGNGGRPAPPASRASQ